MMTCLGKAPDGNSLVALKADNDQDVTAENDGGLTDSGNGVVVVNRIT